MLLCALSLGAAPSRVQAADAAVQAPGSYRIPAGPLLSSLLGFAGQAGVNLSLGVDAARVRGLKAPELAGAFTVEEGFARLLGGSGLRARRVGEGSYLLEPAAATEAPIAAPPQTTSATPSALPDLTVTARTQSDLIAPTHQVTTLEQEQIETLRRGSESLATVLSKAVPGMADSSHTLSDYGMTLRGRDMLVLVDGVPLNTNRNSSRSLANINPADIEQIEVLRGSSAIYGSGAAGGIVSIRTRRPTGETRSETTVMGSVPLSKLSSDGLGGEIEQFFSGGGEIVDYTVSLGAGHIGASFDAHGHRIAPEPSQGDLFDADVYSASAKLGFRLGADRRVQLSASRYDARQDTDYAADPAVRRLPPGSATARPLKGLQAEDQNRVANTLFGLDYEDPHLVADSTLAAQVYYRDFHTRFAPFDARGVVVRGSNVDQTMQDSTVYGGRLTIKTPLSADRQAELVWGSDFNQERSDMQLDIFDAVLYDASGGLVYRKTGRLMYMPPVTTRSLGAFAQLQHRFSDRWSVEGGVRYDRARASFETFVPLSQSRVADPKPVVGGAIRYGAWTYNAGAVFSPVRGQEVYTSYSQGFDLPDIGLQLRNALPSFSVGDSDLQAIKVDTFELGWRGRFANVVTDLSVFQSASDLGAVQSFNNGLKLMRTKERVHGVESSLDYYSDDDHWNVGGTLTWMEGRERPQDALSYQNMTGYRIPPLKLTGHVEYRPSRRWSHRVQLTSYASKDYRLDGASSFGRRETSGYTTVDLISRWQIESGSHLVIGIENLFNRDYYPLYSQLLRNSNNTSRLPAAGTVLRLSYTHRW